MYAVACPCGRQIPVELFQAGTSVTCNECQRTVDVPSMSDLKELSGDTHPFMSAIEKVRATLLACEPPFDGHCQQCQSNVATIEIPVALSIMVERHVQDDGGIRITPMGGIVAHVGASEEWWEELNFPILVCESCLNKSSSQFSLLSVSKYLFTLITLALVGLMFISNADWLELYIVLGLISGAIAVLGWKKQGLRNNIRYERFLKKISWVSEVLQSEEECVISIDSPMPFISSRSIENNSNQ